MLFRELNNEKCKTYLIACEDTQSALIVDPIEEKVDRYLAILAYYGLRLELVLDTHTHADHRSACVELKALTECNIARHQLAPQPNVDIRIDDGDTLEIGKLNADILYTPGHTPDSLSLHINDRILTGDVILIGGTGRADFADGDAATQYDSITQKLFTLPDRTLLFPGHDYRGNTYSSIGHEKQHNPRIANRSKQEYVEIMENLSLPLPDKIQEVLQINQSDSGDTEIDYPSVTELNQILQLTPETVKQLVSSERASLILDVREEDEYIGELGHIKGSKFIPLQNLVARSQEIEDYKNRRIITVCRAGVRSTTAAAILTALEFTEVSNLKGGMIEWTKKNFPIDH